MSQKPYTVIRHDDNIGDQSYPFLLPEWEWQIRTYPLADREVMAMMAKRPLPTLRWVKDDKVCDLEIPDVDCDTFLARTGLRLHMTHGGYTLCKRLSRIMRPFRYWGFFDTDKIQIVHDPKLCPKVWDGACLIGRDVVALLANEQNLCDTERQAFMASQRFEITVLHADGQEKGHAFVCDDIGNQIVLPVGSSKPSLALAETAFGATIFLGLQPVHSRDDVCLDIQSLINLYPFFKPAQLLAYMQMESELFLHSIQSGKMTQVMQRLCQTEADIDQLSNWHVGDYLASGGDPLWFAGITKGVGQQHLNRLGSREQKMRCPIPAGRYYILPAEVGEKEVPAGHTTLDPATATAWVNAQDWVATIVPILGGCDGDDAVWALPFTDRADGQKRVLIWRSPNQVGEYMLLSPTPHTHTIRWHTADINIGADACITYPHFDSRDLPPRIDTHTTTYGQLTPPQPVAGHDTYTVAGIQSAIDQAMANVGVLGRYCNLLMLCQAVYGRLPQHLPATLEAVIDASIKEGGDLTMVEQWTADLMQRMVRYGRTDPAYAIPNSLQARLPYYLRAEAATRTPVTGSSRHWLDALSQAIQNHKAQYTADLAALAATACPPVPLFEHGRDWMVEGKRLRTHYATAWRAKTDLGHDTEQPDYAQARMASTEYLNRWPVDKRGYLLLGTAAYLYATGSESGEPVKDGVLWQLGDRLPDGGRSVGIAEQMIAALRQIGLLGEPVWTQFAGTVLAYPVTTPTPRQIGVPISLRGVWINWLNATGERKYPTMRAVPKPVRQRAKAKVAQLAEEQFRGLVLETAVTDNNRVITRTPHGNLFGYVPRDQELQAVRQTHWRVAWATAVDGNVQAVLHAIRQAV